MDYMQGLIAIAHQEKGRKKKKHGAYKTKSALSVPDEKLIYHPHISLLSGLTGGGKCSLSKPNRQIPIH